MRVSLLHRHLVLILLFGLLSACAKPAPIASPFSSPTSEGTLLSTFPTKTLQATAVPTDLLVMETIEDQSLIHLWALRGVLDAANLQDVATGAPEDDEGCGTLEFSGGEAAGEVILALSYAPSTHPAQVSLWFDGRADEILRVEVMNTTTGLGREVYSGGSTVEETLLVDHDCERILNFPANVDFDVDTVFISFPSLEAASRVDAVELVGNAALFQDALVYWRVPLPAAPVSVTIDQYNQVYIATEDNRIYTYDLEGNQLGEMPPVTEGMISDLVIDQEDNLVFSDAIFGTYSIIYPDGEKLIGGGDAPTVQIAVQPDNGKFFLLDDLGDLLYLVPYFPGTDIIINPLPLDDIAYTGLAFSPDNRLFTIRPIGGFLVELDPISGLEIYSIPLKTAEYIDALPVEFTIDSTGNFYILFTRNEGNSAITVLDPDGAMIRRTGTLTWPVNGDWPEGSFYTPSSIAVTRDGRFALIVDGDAGAYYLTCLMMRED